MPVDVQTPGGSISKVVAGFPGLSIYEVDGCDFVESYRVMGEAVARVRSGEGPALVHAHVPAAAGGRSSSSASAAGRGWRSAIGGGNRAPRAARHRGVTSRDSASRIAHTTPAVSTDSGRATTGWQ